jgi:hypothetical protein
MSGPDVGSPAPGPDVGPDVGAVEIHTPQGMTAGTVQLPAEIFDVRRISR